MISRPETRNPDARRKGGAGTVPRPALAAIDAARDHLSRYALATDWPAVGAVEAADLLDAARDLLAEGAVQ